MNNCVFKGNLVNDPELRTTTNGKPVVNFRLAITHRYKAADGSQNKETAYLNMEAWGTGAENIHKYFQKGDPMLVQAHAKNHVWTDTDGNKRNKICFRVNEFEPCLARKKEAVTV